MANLEAIIVKILVLIPDDSKSIIKSGFIRPQCSSTCLTNEEKEVLILVAKGLPNKQIAGLLGVVEQTIKVHRGRVMSKMEVDSLAQLVLVAERLKLK